MILRALTFAFFFGPGFLIKLNTHSTPNAVHLSQGCSRLHFTYRYHRGEHANASIDEIDCVCPAINADKAN